MKETILVMDEDQAYSKKFCNQANKIYGKKYTFISFANKKNIKEYCESNKANCFIVSNEMVNCLEDVEVNSCYVLNEQERDIYKIGKKTYIYKLQSIKNILEIVDEDLKNKIENCRVKMNEGCKVCLFYSPVYIKQKIEIIKRIARVISKKKKVLILDLDEFANYKGYVGFSNVIYNYKDNNISKATLVKEIISEKEQDYIKSVTYPEDFNVITNIDLANIVNEMTVLDYDYIFINADTSYIKCQYLINDADSVVVMNSKDDERVNVLVAYLKNENQVDYRKIRLFDVEKLDRQYLIAFSKQHFVDKD